MPMCKAEVFWTGDDDTVSVARLTIEMPDIGGADRAEVLEGFQSTLTLMCAGLDTACSHGKHTFNITVVEE